VKRLRVEEGADRAIYGVMPILDKNCWMPRRQQSPSANLGSYDNLTKVAEQDT
jgi:hypothetical protein